ncbi:acetyl-CoA carboxylase carboxyl transferase subunit alpha [Hydrobacter penzbergensis]|jgi:acetyl-CoA carboxylase carboxyl transferase subunit alpha|uniref:Acetyl-coenzyme A carboxylase carboxyl transferase subunit alpha n=1 Tax=Hydrobacter penzbergensis TaxID=1235997 RepID=A0A8X8I8P3_9BACT|nr:acetyl-CoA carboxylase carboxyltransferase subunit alpha [Hydrobacter penzbergensis]MBN8718357.1 acetyl-CoA carboxylase carboxyltransferase subunit alpha [Sediminibacterium magnilacihabitans]PQV62177.1 acetyl-CoA carboxylase carboxyl transferase subunit alpha [Sediminibacterium magnilacihabitans]SDW13321.1 acetyl-CoA carboxylase carboxyl transferase subunit alpha [Hydrobacter penzbergensis]|eukprot:jgi/Mesen1/323/ME1156431C09454
MPHYPNRQFLDFEKPIKELYEQIEDTKKLAEKNPKIDYTSTIEQLEASIIEKRKEITQHLTPWQRVQLSRHPDRPYTMKYIEKMCTHFVELHGDRTFRDDKAMVGGFAQLDGETVMILGQQKGTNTKLRQLRNFGMANPEGYRKALRLMKLAEKFNKPVIALIDTPGAYPGLEAEERGQGEAIARNILEMIRLKVPVIVVIIGEGASGGALGIGVGDKVLMMENTWYTVISPESCSSILWRSWEKKEVAAEQLRLTATDMKGFGLVDEIVHEPLGGAHWDYAEAAAILKSYIIKSLQEIKQKNPQQRINDRIEKYGKMGFWTEAPLEEEEPVLGKRESPEDRI